MILKRLSFGCIVLSSYVVWGAGKMRKTQNKDLELVRLEISGLERALESAKKDKAKNRNLTSESRFELVQFFAKANNTYNLSIDDTIACFESQLSVSRAKLVELNK